MATNVSAAAHVAHYLRDLYQYPGVKETVDIGLFKKGYYGGQSSVNPSGIVPLGPDLDYDAPHDRNRFAVAA